MANLSMLAMPHLVNATDFLQRNLTVDNITWDNAKNLLIAYFVWTRSVKAFRHIRARGLVLTFADVYQWVTKVCVPTLVSEDACSLLYHSVSHI